MKRQLSANEIQDVIQKLESYLSDLKVRWTQNAPSTSWWSLPHTYIHAASQFLISVLDELILFVEGIIPEGTDKKAAVMAMIDKLFDYIVVQAFPFWLRPFAPAIKKIVIDIAISHLIDYIVEKYNAGFWKMPKQEANGEANKVA
jgi:hypothetical protein